MSQDCQFHALLREVSFSFLAGQCNSLSFLVNKILLHCRVVHKMHSVCEKLCFSQNAQTHRPALLNALMY